MHTGVRSNNNTDVRPVITAESVLPTLLYQQGYMLINLLLGLALSQVVQLPSTNNLATRIASNGLFQMLPRDALLIHTVQHNSTFHQLQIACKPMTALRRKLQQALLYIPTLEDDMI